VSDLGFSSAALEDLRQTHGFLRQQVGEDFAAKQIHEILTATELLGRFPRLGTEGFYGPERRRVRRFPVGAYFVYYVETNDGLLVLRVVHSKRDQRQALGQTDQPSNG